MSVFNKLSKNVLFKFKLPIFKIEYLRLCSTKTLTKTTTIKTTKKKVKKQNHASELEAYFLSNKHLLKIRREIPSRFLKKNLNPPDDLYLVDSKIADTIALAIKPYILENGKQTKTIIETNSGFGYITKHLLEFGIQNMQIYDSTVCFRNNILDLMSLYPDRIKLYNRDFFSIWKLSYQDRHDNGDRVKMMLSGVKIKDWSDDPAMTIIGTLCTSNFIRHLLLSLIFQFGIMTYGRCELFLTIPSTLFIQLTSGPSSGYVLYRASSVLFQMFCDIEILSTVPRKAFLPWDRTVEKVLNSKSPLKKHILKNPDTMYLTRIIFKENLPVPMNMLQHLWFFVQHMMLARKSKIIPIMEKWVPGCGVRLITSNNTSKKNCFSNFNIFTECGELTALELLNLFIEFSNWPEYSESPFIASMESVLLKMESLQGNEDHEDILDPEIVETDTK